MKVVGIPKENKSKIIAVNSKYDYVNCLLNSIAGETHYIKTSFQFNPLFYHKGTIMLDYDGNNIIFETVNSVRLLEYMERFLNAETFYSKTS